MKNTTPPNIILHSSKEVIFYISNQTSNNVNTDLWLEALNIKQYKALLITSECIFNRLKKDSFIDK